MDARQTAAKIDFFARIGMRMTMAVIVMMMAVGMVMVMIVAVRVAVIAIVTMPVGPVLMVMDRFKVLAPSFDRCRTASANRAH
jgi:hypothetical protein